MTARENHIPTSEKVGRAVERKKNTHPTAARSYSFIILLSKIMDFLHSNEF